MQPFQQLAPETGPRQVLEWLMERAEAQESAGQAECVLAPILMLSCQYTDWN